MMSVGDTLRRERIKRNLALDQISHELKISPRFLEAIEDERFEKLPGGVFAKAFVRQYGRLLGLNDEELASQLDQMLDPPPIENAATASRPDKTGLAPIQVPRMEEWHSVGDHRRRWFSGSLSAAIMVVLVMLVCSGVYAWLQRPHNPVSAHNNPPAVVASKPPAPQTAQSPAPQTQEQSAVAAAPAPVRQPPSVAPPAATNPGDAAVQAPAQPAVVKPDTSPAAVPNPDATVHVEIIAVEPVWLLVRSDGKFAFTGTMDTNQRRTVDGVKDVVVRLGNAGGVTILLNGQPIPPVGPKGQARTVQFTSGGFHIVPAAKPPSDPLAPIARL